VLGRPVPTTTGWRSRKWSDWSPFPLQAKDVI
jgi:hypothetical protein